jgi:hypothetical protein
MDLRPAAGSGMMTRGVSSRARCRRRGSRRRFRLCLRCLAHAVNFITMRNANPHLRNLAPRQKLADLRNNLPNPHRPVKNSSRPRQRYSLSPRSH